MKRKQLLNAFSKNSKDPLKFDDNFKQKKTFLDTLLTASVDGVQLNDTEILDEVATFLDAGHDTTESAITFALYHHHQYIQKNR